MKKIVLIGDSIRMGYCKYVSDALANAATVHYPNENCRYAVNVLRFAHDWKKKGEWGDDVDLVHWNAGLHDVLRLFEEEPSTPIEIYEYYIDRICQRIKKLCPGAKVIFATSTSVISEKMAADFKRYNEDVEKYNEAAVRIVKRYGFEVNDLYSVSKTLPEEAHSDAVHYYTDMGTEAFSKQVLYYVTKALDLD